MQSSDSRAAHVARPEEEDSVGSSNPAFPLSLRCSFGWTAGAVCAAVVLVIAAWPTALPGQVMVGVDNPTIDAPPAPNPVNAQIQQELRLAGDFLVGKGVQKDPVQSAYWFKKAADQGDAGAQNELGYLYTWALGVPRDDAQAFKWFARAAGQGYEQAKLNMAVMYMRGIGVARDPRFATDLLTELAKRGSARAQDYLGMMYLDGIGVPQDRRVAEEWFSKSAKGKSPEGEFAMGNLYSVEGDHEHDFAKAEKYLRESAHAGYVPAMYALGVLQVKHPEIAQKKPGEALALLERAAEAGTWQSSAALGTLARDGRGRPRDIAEAFRWFAIAVRQGGTEADALMRASMEKCRAALGAEQQEAELRAADSWLAEHPRADLFVFEDMHSHFPVGEVYASHGGAE